MSVRLVTTACGRRQRVEQQVSCSMPLTNSTASGTRAAQTEYIIYDMASTAADDAACCCTTQCAAAACKLVTLGYKSYILQHALYSMQPTHPHDTELS
jgi:nicotinic acid mononucleotide adenylyltransferase